MKVVETGFEGLVIIEPKVFGDHRGYFFESYSQKTFSELGIDCTFVQDNESFSKYGTLRGLHFQKGEFAQAKLVRVAQGSVLDVVLDMRKDSKTFGQHASFELTAENKKMLLVPRGFAHGFIVLSETALFNYKCDNYYSPANEGGVIWNDPDLAIDWKVPAAEILLSAKDTVYPNFKEL